MDTRTYLKSSCQKISDKTVRVFLDYCERIKTPIQRQHYAKLLASVCSFCGCDYPDLKSDRINLWLNQRRAGRSERTFAGELAALRSLFRVMDEEFHSSNYSALGMVDAIKPPVSIMNEDVPSIADADAILEAAKENQALYLAIVLALRCALNITDIVTLKPNMFFVDKDGMTGLRFSQLDAGKREGYIRIPDDIVPFLSGYISILPEGSWLFPSRQRRDYHCTSRWMQCQLNAACRKAGIREETKVTFRSLRALSIISMLEGGAKTSQVAEYVSMKDSALHYYGSVVPELKNSAVVHSRIRIVDPGEEVKTDG